MDYNTKIAEMESKIFDVTNLATKTALTTVENKIPGVTNLETKTALTTIENKIPDVSSLVKKRIITLELLSLDGKIAENKTKNESIKNKLEKVIKIHL